MSEPSERTEAAAPEYPSTVEVVAVIIMSLTAILSAWSGFQAAKWGGNMSVAFSQAGAARTESVRMSNLANQQSAVDIGLFSSFLEARAGGDDAVADFYLERFPDRLRGVTEQWLDLDPIDNPDAPKSPFAMDGYVVAAAVDSDALKAEAEQHAADARDHNQQSDNYVVLSVMFATVLFFAALSTKLVRRVPRMVMLGGAVVGFVVGALIIATMPIQL